MGSQQYLDVHPGDRVCVHRDSAYGAVETAVVLEVRKDRSLRLEFPDGHRSAWRGGAARETGCWTSPL